MIARRLAALVALTLAVARVASPQGTPSVVIRVLERTTQQPLPNAEVIDLDGGARRFTNDEGEARLAWGPPAGFACACGTSAFSSSIETLRIGRGTAGAALLTACWSCLLRVTLSLSRGARHAGDTLVRRDADSVRKATPH